MKRIVIFLICLLTICTTLTPIVSIAVEPTSDKREIIILEDGSYIEIVTTENFTRSSGSKTGNKSYTYWDNDGNAMWKAVLTASFTYTGSSSTCTNASCSVTIYDSSWYQVSKSTSYSGNTATTQLTMGHKVLGVTVSKPSYTITLSCDANGNLS